MKQINYKEEYKRMKAKENLRAMIRLAIVFVGLVVFKIMR